MHLDVQDLGNFYYRSALGRRAQVAIRSRVLDLWPEAKGQTVAGFGFATPLLRPYIKEARRVVALMPGPQGVMPWPARRPNVSVLTEETMWPLETGHVDRLILMHGLETSERASELLEECFRVLGPGGKALFVVPNRSGIWARRDGTPFGFGRPYSIGQLDSQLKRHNFLPERHLAALYQPPFERRFWRKTGPLVEKMGRTVLMSAAGGVLIVEASKRVYPPRSNVIRDAVRKPATALEGAVSAARPEPARSVQPDHRQNPNLFVPDPGLSPGKPGNISCSKLWRKRSHLA